VPIWKITPKGPVKVTETKLKQEKLLEENLENWVEKDTTLLGEPLLVIGRQVIIPEVNDRLDLLALDPQGKAVVIELKRGKLSDPVDMQCLRYASYVSKWRYEDFENQARAYLGKDSDSTFNFNDMFEQFCSEAGVDTVPDLNTDQRLIIVGSEVRDKLGSVALWLLDHSIDIKVIEVESYREGDVILVQPRTIVPLPVSRFAETGRNTRGETAQPWVADGKTWHLEKRCGPKTRAMLLKLDDLIRDTLDVEGPRWDQKFYVAYRVGNNIWLSVETRATNLCLNFIVKQGSFKQSDVAKGLGIDEYDKEEPLSKKLGLQSSILVDKRNATSDRIVLRLKEGFDIENDMFVSFVKEAYQAFPA
jgi:hypothetical protein